VRLKLAENLPVAALAVLRVLEAESLTGKLWIADPSRVRVRP
jgi:hypothetical protein